MGVGGRGKRGLEMRRDRQGNEIGRGEAGAGLERARGTLEVCGGAVSGGDPEARDGPRYAIVLEVGRSRVMHSPLG
eukprot:scaffold133307_cov84-Phaeocystis_antarctica.AAC.3